MSTPAGVRVSVCTAATGAAAHVGGHALLLDDIGRGGRDWHRKGAHVGACGGQTNQDLRRGGGQLRLHGGVIDRVQVAGAVECRLVAASVVFERVAVSVFLAARHVVGGGVKRVIVTTATLELVVFLVVKLVFSSLSVRYQDGKPVSAATAVCAPVSLVPWRFARRRCRCPVCVRVSVGGAFRVLLFFCSASACINV